MGSVDLNQQVNNFFKEALKSFFMNDYDESIRNFKAAEVLDKNNPEISYNLGVVYSRMGLYNTAEQYFKKILNMTSKTVRILEVKKLYAYALIKNKNYKKAIKLLNQVLDDASSDIIALNMKGYCLEKSEQYKEAFTTYKNIIEYDKENTNAYNSMACIIILIGGDVALAIKFVEKALKLDKDNPAYLDTAAYLHMKSGNKLKALEFINNARKNAPFSEEIKNHLLEIMEMD